MIVHTGYPHALHISENVAKCHFVWACCMTISMCRSNGLLNVEKKKRRVRVNYMSLYSYCSKPD